MAEVLFYQLTASPLEASLPELLERSLARGWRVLLRCGSEAGMASLDEHALDLERGLVPAARHRAGRARGAAADLSHPRRREPERRQRADAGRRRPRRRTAEMAGFERTCLLFDGHDARALEAARADWRAVKAAALPAKYWAQEQGRWVEKAS